MILKKKKNDTLVGMAFSCSFMELWLSRCNTFSRCISSSFTFYYFSYLEQKKIIFYYKNFLFEMYDLII